MSWQLAIEKAKADALAYLSQESRSALGDALAQSIIASADHLAECVESGNTDAALEWFYGIVGSAIQLEFEALGLKEGVSSGYGWEIELRNRFAITTFKSQPGRKKGGSNSAKARGEDKEKKKEVIRGLLAKYRRSGYAEHDIAARICNEQPFEKKLTRRSINDYLKEIREEEKKEVS